VLQRVLQGVTCSDCPREDIRVYVVVCVAVCGVVCVAACVAGCDVF